MKSVNGISLRRVVYLTSYTACGHPKSRENPQDPPAAAFLFERGAPGNQKEEPDKWPP